MKQEEKQKEIEKQYHLETRIIRVIVFVGLMVMLYLIFKKI